MNYLKQQSYLAFLAFALGLVLSGMAFAKEKKKDECLYEAPNFAKKSKEINQKIAEACDRIDIEQRVAKGCTVVRDSISALGNLNKQCKELKLLLENSRNKICKAQKDAKQNMKDSVKQANDVPEEEANTTGRKAAAAAGQNAKEQYQQQVKTATEEAKKEVKNKAKELAVAQQKTGGGIVNGNRMLATRLANVAKNLVKGKNIPWKVRQNCAADLKALYGTRHYLNHVLVPGTEKFIEEIENFETVIDNTVGTLDTDSQEGLEEAGKATSVNPGITGDSNGENGRDGGGTPKVSVDPTFTDENNRYEKVLKILTGKSPDGSPETDAQKGEIPLPERPPKVATPEDEALPIKNPVLEEKRNFANGDLPLPPRKDTGQSAGEGNDETQTTPTAKADVKVDDQFITPSDLDNKIAEVAGIEQESNSDPLTRGTSVNKKLYEDGVYAEVIKDGVSEGIYRFPNSDDDGEGPILYGQPEKVDSFPEGQYMPLSTREHAKALGYEQIKDSAYPDGTGLYTDKFGNAYSDPNTNDPNTKLSVPKFDTAQTASESQNRFGFVTSEGREALGLPAIADTQESAQKPEFDGSYGPPQLKEGQAKTVKTANEIQQAEQPAQVAKETGTAKEVPASQQPAGALREVGNDKVPHIVAEDAAKQSDARRATAAADQNGEVDQEAVAKLKEELAALNTNDNIIIDGNADENGTTTETRFGADRNRAQEAQEKASNIKETAGEKVADQTPKVDESEPEKLSKDEPSENARKIINTKEHPINDDFKKLKGWAEDDHLESFNAFRSSCNKVENSALKSVCARAEDVAASIKTPTQARKFFEANFKPVKQDSSGGKNITGYATPAIEASKEKTDEFSVPLYGKPSSSKKLELTRKELETGALASEKPIAYLRNWVDKYKVDTEGGAILEYPDGTKKSLHFAAANKHGFQSAGTLASLESNLDKAETTIRDKNPRYIFWKETELSPTEGSKNNPLQDGRSLAADPKLHSFGKPIYISSDNLLGPDGNKGVNRLGVVHDVGDAINSSKDRLDFFHGHGREPYETARLSKDRGTVYAFEPRSKPLAFDPQEYAGEQIASTEAAAEKTASVPTAQPTPTQENTGSPSKAGVEFPSIITRSVKTESYGTKGNITSGEKAQAIKENTQTPTRAEMLRRGIVPHPDETPPELDDQNYKKDILRPLTRTLERAGIVPVGPKSLKDLREMSVEDLEAYLQIQDSTNPNAAKASWANKNRKPVVAIVSHSTEDAKTLKRAIEGGHTYDRDRNGVYGYTHYIDRDGTIHQARKYNDRTNQIDRRKGIAKEMGFNNGNTVGFAFVGKSKWGLTPQQINAARGLKILYEKVYNKNQTLPLYTHAEINGTNHRMSAEGINIFQMYPHMLPTRKPASIPKQKGTDAK